MISSATVRVADVKLDTTVGVGVDVSVGGPVGEIISVGATTLVAMGVAVGGAGVADGVLMLCMGAIVAITSSFAVGLDIATSGGSVVVSCKGVPGT